VNRCSSKNNPQLWNGNIPWASVKDLKESKYLEKTIDYITELGIQKSSTNLIPKGRVIICTRMGLGKIAINSYVCRLTGISDIEYVLN
jgi:type I restriction enzyme S subunit